MFKTHLIRVIIGVIIGALLGGAYYKLTSPVYLAQATLIIADNTPSRSVDADTSSLLSTGLGVDVISEVQILRDEQTFRKAIFQVAQDTTPQTYQSIQQINEAYIAYDGPKLFLQYDVQAIRGSRVAAIEVRAPKSDLAISITDAVIKVYNDNRVQTGKKSLDDTQVVLKTQVQGAQRDLETKESELRRFKEQNKLISLPEKTGEVARYEGQLVEQLDQAGAEKLVVQAEIDTQKGKLSQLPPERIMNVQTVKPATLLKLESELSDYERQRTELLRTYTPESVRVRQLDKVIQSTTDRIVELKKTPWEQVNRDTQTNPVRLQVEQSLTTAEVKASGLDKRLGSLQSALATVRQTIQGLPAIEMKLAELTRDRSILELRYNRLKANSEEVNNRTASFIKQAQIVYGANANTLPIWPDLTKVLAISIVGGACVGLMFSFAREALRANVRTSNELSELVGLPVGATAPMLPNRQSRLRMQALPGPDFKPLESYRFMASSMLFSNGSKPNRVLFTSVGGEVGCSMAAGEFALSAAKMGLRVILVDADLRRGTISRVFKMRDRSGVRDVINRSLLPGSGTEIFSETEHANLFVLPAGSSDGEGITDVPISHLSGFLDNLQEKADLIVIDVPPCDVVADASRFVPLVDEVCLVVSARNTNYRIIPMAKDLLNRAGAKKVSMIMTDTTPNEEAFSRFNKYVASN